MINAMKTLAILFIFLSINLLNGQELYKVSFNDLSDQYSEKNIEIRGFLYQTETGNAILAPQPNLRSCCVGSEQRAHEQIALVDLKSVPVATQAVDIQGIFHIDPESNLKSLTEAKLVEKSRGVYHLTMMAVVAALLFTFFLARRRS